VELKRDREALVDSLFVDGKVDVSHEVALDAFVTHKISIANSERRRRP
jgi:hypothetical protein